MRVCKAKISHEVFDFLNKIIISFNEKEAFNAFMYETYRIVEFCLSDDDFNYLKTEIGTDTNRVEEDRTEYGDFQTPYDLVEKTCKILSSKNFQPKICIEPTCGKGRFVLGALRNFSSLTHMYGIEIYKPYVWETKFNLLAYYLSNKSHHRPIIHIIHESVFLYDFKKLAKKHAEEEVLLLGNPPWVTNSKLGQLDSQNLPVKRNLKQLSGFDALTGKSNFDIAEFILLELFKRFQAYQGKAIFLIKNAVVKNIIQASKKNTFQISDFKQYTFDAKKEFNVATEASAFLTSFNKKSVINCSIQSLYEPQKLVKTFGWYNNNFVSNIATYQALEKYDGQFPFTWRSGVKHDCTKIFELKKEGQHYVNKQKEILDLEDDLIFPLIKSSQLKEKFIRKSANYIIVTQKKIGAATHYIEQSYPKLYQYLDENRERINSRKSSIYKGKPPFSMFGLGNYTFKTYKIAISGLYKKANFSLLIPENEKPLIADDTCYTIGFQNLKFAVIVATLLNADTCIKFLNAITFQDAKRVYTKDVLMRINLIQLLEDTDKDDLMKKGNVILEELKHERTIEFDDILAFKKSLQPREMTMQMNLFA